MAAQSIAPVVLLTRPAAQSARFAERLRARMPGLTIVTSPLIAPTYLNPIILLKPWKGIILSSETGAEAAGRIKASLPDLAFCVGDRTAQAARAAGFIPRSAEGDAEALLALILSQPMAPLLHLRGREARGELAKRLSANGIETDEAVVYAQDEQSLTYEAIALLHGPSPILAPVFSPRSAEILAAECRRIKASAPVTLLGMSAAVAAVAGPWSANALVAAQPTAESMADRVIEHLAAGYGA
jgi:uroporphyrinogen-III synthase